MLHIFELISAPPCHTLHFNTYEFLYEKYRAAYETRMKALDQEVRTLLLAAHGTRLPSPAAIPPAGSVVRYR